MKVTFEVDNDIIVALATFMNATDEEKATIKAYLEQNESIELVPADLKDKTSAQQMQMALAALVISKI